MCKKYARCLYCFSKDEYRCAKAHDRLMIALERGVRKFPAYLLHEPPIEVLEGKPAPAKGSSSRVRVKSTREAEGEKEPKEEMVETIAHILSGYNMNSLSEERTRELMKISAMLESTEEDNSAHGANVLAHTRHAKDDVPLFILRKRKSK